MALSKDKISKIGLGTWGLGGFKDYDESIDQAAQIEAVAYALKKGINYAETTLWYAEGHSARILSKAIEQSGVKRSEIFLSQTIYDHDHPTFATAKKELQEFHKIFNTDYSDSIMFSMPGFQHFGYEEVCSWLDEQLNAGTARYVSTTNANKEFVQKLKDRFGSKFYAHELHFNFEIRETEDHGVIQADEQCGVKTVIAQPLRRNRTANHNWPLLVELSKKYELTQNQLILAWMLHRDFLPLVKSTNIQHIDENLAAVNVALDKEDITKLNNWRPDYSGPEIDWHSTGKGVTLHQLPNVFDEEYANQHKG